MFKSLKRSAKGAAVPHTKATAGQPTNKMPVPEHVVIPMSMHIGAPAEPVVKKGDTVMVGTVIGKAGGFVSANIYSSVSGTVQDIAPLRMVNGAMTTAVAIKTDGAQTVDPTCVPPVVTDKASLLAAVQALQAEALAELLPGIDDMSALMSGFREVVEFGTADQK